jgi:4,5-dihydroxyphthalate decarboxylase
MKLPLTLAIGPYDHVRDLATGAVGVEGIDLRVLHFPVEEIFHRFTLHREWDVSEMSFGKYIALVSQGDRSLVALPVFPSRVFRHSSMYVRRGSASMPLPALRGKRIGVPEWAQTAAVYSRGILVHEGGVPLASVEWHQAGVNEPGRAEKVDVRLPEGVRLVRHADRSLDELLAAGEIDAVFSARPPNRLASGEIVRLFADPRAAEEAWYRSTGIFPIMHVVSVKREAFDANRWIAMNLCAAFEEAKRRSLARMTDIAAAHVPLAWAVDHARSLQASMGEDCWPYGIEPNRPTLEAFARYAHEQGVAQRRVEVDELFPPEVHRRVRV